MICHKCGATIPDDSVFCENCGEPLETTEYIEESVNAEEEPVYSQDAKEENEVLFTVEDEKDQAVVVEENDLEESVEVEENEFDETAELEEQTEELEEIDQIDEPEEQFVQKEAFEPEEVNVPEEADTPYEAEKEIPADIPTSIEDLKVGETGLPTESKEDWFRSFEELAPNPEDWSVMDQELVEDVETTADEESEDTSYSEDVQVERDHRPTVEDMIAEELPDYEECWHGIDHKPTVEDIIESELPDASEVPDEKYDNQVSEAPEDRNIDQPDEGESIGDKISEGMSKVNSWLANLGKSVHTGTGRALDGAKEKIAALRNEPEEESAESEKNAFAGGDESTAYAVDETEKPEIDEEYQIADEDIEPDTVDQEGSADEPEEDVAPEIDEPEEPAAEVDEPEEEAPETDEDIELDTVDQEGPADETEEPAAEVDEPEEEAPETDEDIEPDTGDPEGTADEPEEDVAPEIGEPEEPAAEVDEPEEEAPEIDEYIEPETGDREGPADEPEEPAAEVDEPDEEAPETDEDIEPKTGDREGSADEPEEDVPPEIGEPEEPAAEVSEPQTARQKAKLERKAAKAIERDSWSDAEIGELNLSPDFWYSSNKKYSEDGYHVSGNDRSTKTGGAFLTAKRLKLIVILGAIAVLIIGTGGVIGSSIHKEKEAEAKYNATLAQGEKYMNAKDYEKAEAVYSKLIGQYPDRAELYENLAKTYIEDEKFEQAKKTIETGVTKTGKSEAFTALSEEVKASTSNEWKEPFRRVLAGNEWAVKKYEDVNDVSVALCDVTGDRKPELFFFTQEYYGYGKLHIYTYAGNKAQEITYSNKNRSTEYNDAFYDVERDESSYIVYKGKKAGEFGIYESFLHRGVDSWQTINEFTLTGMDCKKRNVIEACIKTDYRLSEEDEDDNTEYYKNENEVGYKTYFKEFKRILDDMDRVVISSKESSGEREIWSNIVDMKDNSVTYDGAMKILDEDAN